MSSTGMANNPNLSQAFILLTNVTVLRIATHPFKNCSQGECVFPPYREILFLTDPFTTACVNSLQLAHLINRSASRIRYDQPAKDNTFPPCSPHHNLPQVRIAAPIQLVLANFIEEPHCLWVLPHDAHLRQSLTATGGRSFVLMEVSNLRAAPAVQ